MIHWDLRPIDEHPDLLEGRPPAGLLSAPERVYCERLATPKRRREWLHGRYVAKALLRAFLASEGREVASDRLTVAPSKDGSPRVLLAGEGPLPLTLSISHRAGWALCGLVAEPEAAFGVDLELCEPRSKGFEEDFFTGEEQACFEKVLPAERARAVTEAWALKEAALKALRMGLRADTRSVSATPRAQREAGWSCAAVRVEGRQAAAFARDHGECVMAVVHLGGAPSAASRLELEAPVAAPAAAPMIFSQRKTA